MDFSTANPNLLAVGCDVNLVEKEFQLVSKLPCAMSARRFRSKLTCVFKYALVLFCFLYFLFTLQVGFYDGGIAVYNVRKSVDEPVLDNL